MKSENNILDFTGDTLINMPGGTMTDNILFTAGNKGLEWDSGSFLKELSGVITLSTESPANDLKILSGNDLYLKSTTENIIIQESNLQIENGYNIFLGASGWLKETDGYVELTGTGSGTGIILSTTSADIQINSATSLTLNASGSGETINVISENINIGSLSSNININIGASGTNDIDITAAQISLTGDVTIDGELHVNDVFNIVNGIVSEPSYSFEDHPSTGMFYNSGDSTLSFAFNGSRMFYVNSLDFIMNGNITATNKATIGSGGLYVNGSTGSGGIVNAVPQWDGMNGYSLKANSSTYFGNPYTYLSSSNSVLFKIDTVGGIVTNATTASTSASTGALIVAGGVGIAGNIFLGGTAKAGDGSASAPSFSFISDENTGLYSVGADDIGVAVGGNLKLDISSTLATLAVPVKLPSYTVAGVPSALTLGAGTIIYVSNESGGAILAFSDGTNWRRVQDRVVIS